MDVERDAFPALLPSLLKHVSNAHFIAFDLELSGIPTQKKRNGRQTLEERYLETKAAAETYHILQVGLTLVEEDAEDDRYLLRSYNFNLSPLIYEGLDMERSFTYSSGAVDFLLRQGYRMEAPFQNAIPYLTRAEEPTAREQTRRRWDRDAIPDIKVARDNVQALEFMRRVRSDVDAWKKTKKPESKYHTVTGIAPTNPDTSLSTTSTVVELNRFERRLVHQIIRSEYPSLRTYSDGGFVRVRERGLEDRESAQDVLDRRLKRAMFNQIGFRWVAEAMAGSKGNLSDIDLGVCARQIDGEPLAEDLASFTARMDKLRDVLKQRTPVLVGHNCFLDLVYFYKNFYGELPDTLADFHEAIHALFPLIVDTKYIATSGHNYNTFRSFQLSQLDEVTSNDTTPNIDYAKDHPRHPDAANYHEAGYDSFVTAKVLLRFAMRLDAEMRQSDNAAKHELEDVVAKDVNDQVSHHESSGSVFAAVEKKKRPKRKPKSSATSELLDGKFFSQNMYDALQAAESQSGTAASDTHAAMNRATHPDVNDITDGAVTLSIDPDSRPHSQEDANSLVPRWDSDFWSTYGNKLRVYGTVEEMCDLALPPARVEKDVSDVAAENSPKDEVEASPDKAPSSWIWQEIGKTIRSFM